jgi:hypothetical protein
VPPNFGREGSDEQHGNYRSGCSVYGPIHGDFYMGRRKVMDTAVDRCLRKLDKSLAEVSQLTEELEEIKLRRDETIAMCKQLKEERDALALANSELVKEQKDSYFKSTDGCFCGKCAEKMRGYDKTIDEYFVLLSSRDAAQRKAGALWALGNVQELARARACIAQSREVGRALEGLEQACGVLIDRIQSGEVKP